MQGLGGNGPKLLLLHATGFHGLAYTPLAAALKQQFDCYTLDFPGHGTAAALTLPSYTVAAVAEYLTEAVDAAHLRGCFCFGHSAGGAFAIIASSRSPGLFNAICSFEAVVSTPATHAYMRQARDSGAIATAGGTLAAMALRRRAVFASKADALVRLTQKPPMAAMHTEAARLFVQHGTRPLQQPQQQLSQQQQHTSTSMLNVHSQTHELQQQVELVCAPTVESAYYQALDPPPAVPLAGPGCPLLLLVAGHPGSTASLYSTHGAVQQWLLQNMAGKARHQAASTLSATADGASSSSHGLADAGASLHAVLSVLNAELASSLPAARLVEVEGLSHFGPLEQPQRVADMAAAYFQRQQQQQQHSKL
ncbi:Alpha/Beta hydrolase protein [Scenedesmus sp. NREL 46B-D3]|nr:Alpha/Beta hydrolase protein [Scenedesmus sp. NREL 46B-D3]